MARLCSVCSAIPLTFWDHKWVEDRTARSRQYKHHQSYAALISATRGCTLCTIIHQSCCDFGIVTQEGEFASKYWIAKSVRNRHEAQDITLERSDISSNLCFVSICIGGDYAASLKWTTIPPESHGRFQILTSRQYRVGHGTLESAFRLQSWSQTNLSRFP